MQQLYLCKLDAGCINVAIDFKNKRYHILYIGIRGGSGMAVKDPHNGRYYLVSLELFGEQLVEET